MAKPMQDEKGNYWCGHCKTYKPLDEFYNPPKGYRSNRSQYCKDCTVEVKWIHRQKAILKVEGAKAFQKLINESITRLTIRQQLLTQYLKGELK